MHLAYLLVVSVSGSCWIFFVNSRWFYLNKWQRPCAPGTRHCTTSRAVNAYFNSTGSVATKQLWPQLCRLHDMGIVQQRVYQSRVHNINELNQRLLHVWQGIDQTITDNAIDEGGRLRASVWAKGGHFKQLLWQYSGIWQEMLQFLSNMTRFLDYIL